MGTAILLVVAVMAVFITIYFARHRDAPARARFLRGVGFAITAVFGAFFALFLAGETISDPGGWESAGLTPDGQFLSPHSYCSPGAADNGQAGYS